MSIAQKYVAKRLNVKIILAKIIFGKFIIYCNFV